MWQKVLSRAFEKYFSFFRLMRKKMDWSRENILTTNTNLIGGCEVTVTPLMALLDTNGKVSSLHMALQSYVNKKMQTKLLN